MNTLTQGDKDKLTKAYADALNRHLRYIADQNRIIQGTQPAKP
jgi:hypothetical protein